MLMRSVPLVAPRRLELIETHLPGGPRAGELLVRMRAVGVCGSDLHWWAEGRIHRGLARYPMVLGHEPAGEIVETGPGVKDFKAGDRVSIEPSLTCGHCEWCLQGRHNLCQVSRFMGGPDAYGFLRDYVVVPAHNADRVPDNLSWREAVLIEPLAVLVHVYELAPVRVHQTVAVLGTGSIGLIAVAMARAAGASKIFACDRVPHRLELARRMGADVTANLREEDFAAAVLDATSGHGADICFDCAGAPETINLGLKVAKRGGRFVLIGIPEPLEFIADLHTAMAKELAIQTIRRSNHKGAAAARLLESGQIPASIVTHALPLEKAQEGFETVHACADGVGKLLFDFSL
jgi:L-iditol 2-dehydrogenase